MNWKSVIREVGERYGTKLAGWWFDDGAVNYYYRSPDWLSLYQAAKVGNPKRLVGFNPWKLPPPTQFMDYYVGETITDPSSGGTLKKGGDGRIQNGSYKGLQAGATMVTESDEWGHFKKDANKFKISSSSAVGTNARLTIDGSGNVGIGTASPRL